MISDWAGLRAFALGLGLPEVVDATSWGNPVLKAHGKLWCWWSPYVDAAIFKGTLEEREALIAADPATFLWHDHYRNHGLLLVAAGRIDEAWATARLMATWRAQAPKRFLTAWDAGQA
ncbi:MAG: MmcQ/YjbR family DNA-binding protein [Pseudomonadota bacterium]